MKDNKKTQAFTIHLDEPTAEQITTLAEHYQRKPAELLRLVLVPALCELWAKMEREKHEENKQAPTLARFKK